MALGKTSELANLSLLHAYRVYLYHHIENDSLSEREPRDALFEQLSCIVQDVTSHQYETTLLTLSTQVKGILPRTKSPTSKQRGQEPKSALSVILVTTLQTNLQTAQPAGRDPERK